MRMRKKKWAESELANCSFFIDNPVLYKGNWKTLFNNDNPIHLDLGCGKCVSTSRLAYLNPNVNYICIDIVTSILGVARRNIAAVFSDRTPSNILLVKCNVNSISDYFSTEDCIDKIYINFPNPWDKRRKHEKRRLTYPLFLDMYSSFMKKGSSIWFKTDNEVLFDKSLEYFPYSGYRIGYINRDYEKSGFDHSVKTEHEIMFSDNDVPIKFLIAFK